MNYGYARVSTGGQSVDAQLSQLTKAGCKKVFRETVGGAKNRTQLRHELVRLNAGNVLVVTRFGGMFRQNEEREATYGVWN
jgi:DNA invertase Pin-like site-specific DNA recombinase